MRTLLPGPQWSSFRELLALFTLRYLRLLMVFAEQQEVHLQMPSGPIGTLKTQYRM